MTLLLGAKKLSLAQLRGIAREGDSIALDPACMPGLQACVAAVERIVASGVAAYGINTGFGKLAQTRIPRDELARLQRNLVLSHATGTGPHLSDETVRLVLALKIASLAQGHSGVRTETVEALERLYNQRIYPCIPSRRAPLAHRATSRPSPI